MKYKQTKAAAHNFGHSFVSGMNCVDDDFLIGHLARRPRRRVKRSCG